MSGCCPDKSCEVTALRARHERVLWIVLAINTLMFFIKGGAGLLAHSTSLMADSLDMLGDALVYGFSLVVLARSARWPALRWQKAPLCWSSVSVCWPKRSTRLFIQ